MTGGGYGNYEAGRQESKAWLWCDRPRCSELAAARPVHAVSVGVPWGSFKPTASRRRSAPSESSRFVSLCPNATSSATPPLSPQSPHQICLESLPILLSDLVRVHPGRPAALPTATGWDEELQARTAGVRLPRPGHSESSFRTDPSVCPIMLRHRYR